MSALDIALGIVGAGVAFALLGAALYFAAQAYVVVTEHRRRVAQRQAAEAQRRADDAAYRQRVIEMAGPFAGLIEAIERAPEGRWQLDARELERGTLPDEWTVDRYLNSRWPGLELWRHDERADLGIIYQWRGRP